MKKQTALVVGATGLVGQELVAQLLADDRFDRITVWVRRMMELQHPKLSQMVVDFDALPENGRVGNADVAFCTLGTTIKKAGSEAAQYKIDFEYVLSFANVCARNQVGCFAVVSSLGADPLSRNFYLRTKGEMEVALQDLPFDHHVIVRPSLLLGKRKEFRLGEKIAMGLMKVTDWMMVGSLKKFKAIKASTVASALIRESVSERKGIQIVESDEL